MLARMSTSALSHDMHMGSSNIRGAIMAPLCSNTFPPALHHVAGPPKRTRPTLSLDTVSASGYNANSSSSSSSFNLESLSVVTPTTRNTISNTFLPRTPLTLQACAPRSPLPCPDIKIISPPTESTLSLEIKIPSPQNYTHNSLPPSPRSPRSPSSSPRRALPLDTSFASTKLKSRVTKPKPIMTTTTSSSAPRSPRIRDRRKRVSFRSNLTEEIQTNTYVSAHSDLLNSPSVDRTAMMLPSPTFVGARMKPSPLPFSSRTESRTENRWRAAIEALAGETEALVKQAEREGQEMAKRLSIPSKRSSIDENAAEEEDVCPATPVVRSSKRTRYPADDE
ncbi:hypothetical protein BDZ85DRAFT_251506 [Elsinoe ampelina]|uniref:Uncharacterized protein n=1 Tax=Elsinoe ampelina TaxID=302913 RepID=A0A6A6G5Y0_9PEZI|nr:hypothetical protein BDZ85DRAFT_251506 [Elsinoe ampelina]